MPSGNPVTPAEAGSAGPPVGNALSVTNGTPPSDPVTPAIAGPAGPLVDVLLSTGTASTST
eukprot:6314839-Alexandrium_andersonii.AAC.1